jgi:hypothetical protein
MKSRPGAGARQVCTAALPRVSAQIRGRGHPKVQNFALGAMFGASSGDGGGFVQFFAVGPRRSSADPDDCRTRP